MNCTLLQDLDGLIEPVTRLACEAGHRILELFRSDALEVRYKADRTPVTNADQAAHEHIVAGLERLTPGTPVLSEESGAYKYTRRRSGWDWHWLVDPLDGTRRFIRGSEEFTVNIALIRGGKPVLGVVDAPAMGTVYFGHEGGGAFLCEGDSGAPSPISVRQPPARPVRVLAGRSHTVSAVELYVSALGVKHWRRISSSLKFCLIARGEASPLFGNPQGDALEEILGNVEQTMCGEPVYRTREEKAAHLLYFLVKDRPFTAGNKRIGSLLFLLYLRQEGLDHDLNPQALTALTLMIATSAAGEKDLIIRLVVNLLAEPAN